MTDEKVEDILTQKQRIKLEALAQAIAFRMGRASSPADIVSTAKQFESYIRDA